MEQFTLQELVSIIECMKHREMDAKLSDDDRFEASEIRRKAESYIRNGLYSHRGTWPYER